MSENKNYTVLARKHRPQTFDEVAAQGQINTILKNAVQLNRIAPAYLFTGPRGVGKTSMARIFAKSLNCVHGPTAEPCLVCENCTEITAGTSPDVIEIDGASNTGVDDIRELQKELMYTATKSRYKIYIIDEVHMLSKSAFNALLKTLEEPPESVVFIFATTEPHKVLPTIISRCQRFDFKRISIEDIVNRLKHIAQQENFTIDEEALTVIAAKADGGMRDALSLTDQVLAFGGDSVTYNDVLGIFGMVHNEIYLGMFGCIINQDASQMIAHLHSILENGYDIIEFINGMLEFNRLLLLLKLNIKTPEIPPRLLPPMQEAAGHFSENDLLYISTYLIKLKGDLKNSDHHLQLAELAFIKLAKMASLKSVPELLEELRSGNIEQSTPAKKVSFNTNPPAKPSPRVSKPAATPVPTPASATPSQPAATQTSSASFNTQAFNQQLPELVKQLVQAGWATAPTIISTCEFKVDNSVLIINANNSFALKTIMNNEQKLQQAVQQRFGALPVIKVSLKAVKETTATSTRKELPTLPDLKKDSPDLAEFVTIMDTNIQR